MPKQKLMDELVNRYEDSAMFGKSAKKAGVFYSVKNKCFSIEISDQWFDRPANFVADHPKGGDELSANIKRWIQA